MEERRCPNVDISRKLVGPLGEAEKGWEIASDIKGLERMNKDAKDVSKARGIAGAIGGLGENVQQTQHVYIFPCSFWSDGVLVFSFLSPSFLTKGRRGEWKDE